MRKEFKEYYQYSEAEINTIWKNAVFIFDTNILQGLYRMNVKTREDFLKILTKLKQENRIWTPHQVLKEYHRNRRLVIIGLEKNYQDAINTITSLSTLFSEKFKGKLKSACENHPLLNTDDVYQKVETSLNSITEEITKIKSTHPKWKEDDTILKEIEKIFDNFGKKFSEEELKKITQEGEVRFKNKIPPGYADDKANGGDKDGDNKFGDLIIWKQILDYSKNTNKPIVFVTDDTKEDWWLFEYDKPFSPRYELRKEIGNIDFEMYTSDQFLKMAAEKFNQRIEEESIREIRRIRNLTEESNIVFRNRFKHPFFRQFMMLQNKLNHRLMHLVEDLKLNKDIIYEINDHQIKIKYLIEMINSEGIINPAMMEELSRLEDNFQSKLLEYVKLGKVNNNASIEIFRYIDERIYLYRRLMKYSDMESLPYERFYRKMRQNKDHLMDFVEIPKSE